jgi:hypothetical protein
LFLFFFICQHSANPVSHAGKKENVNCDVSSTLRGGGGLHNIRLVMQIIFKKRDDFIFFFSKNNKNGFFFIFLRRLGASSSRKLVTQLSFFFVVVVSYQRQNPKPTGRTLDIKLQIALCVCVFYHCLLSSRYLWSIKNLFFILFYYLILQGIRQARLSMSQ